MNTIAPEIFRKRLLIEGYFTASIDEETIKNFFAHLTKQLDLRTYGEPIVHSTSGVGKESNQGYDAFVPLIDSGIYLGVWVNQKFLSLIVFTCKEFDDVQAKNITMKYLGLTDLEFKLF